jgi:hypothetical protein
VFGLVACLASGSSSGDYCILAGLFPPLLIGLSQLAYMLPAILIAPRRQRRDVAKGLIIGAAITFTLNAACWGTLYLPGVFFRY